MKQLYNLVYLFGMLSFAQPPNDGFYNNSLEDDHFKIPNSNNINHATINSRTYETYFKATSTVARQVIFMEGGNDRAIFAYIEGDYLIVGAHNKNDYTPEWDGTFFRKQIAPDTWYHVALVFDNAQPPVNDPIGVSDNTNLKWYLDGILQDEKAGFQIGGTGDHDELLIGFKDKRLWFPNCGIWTSAGLSEYCFNSTINDNGGNEYYFDGYLYGFRIWNYARSATQINDNKSKLILPTEDITLLAVLDGDTITYQDDNSLLQDEDNANPTTTKEWEGNDSVDWTNTLNWKNGLVPDDSKQEPVLIKNGSTFYPEISGTVIVGDIEVQAGANLTIKSDQTLEVAYDVLNDGNFTIENNASLFIRESKNVTGIGSYSIERITPDYPQDYFYSIWSTPVTEVDSELGTIFTDDIDAFKYDASQNPSAYVSVPKTEAMEVGRGYFIRSSTGAGLTTRTFTGTLNNGNIVEPIYFNGPADNFNLIGNPYISAIDWLKFQEDNSAILNGTAYYWRQTMTGVNNSVADFIEFNSTGSNPPGATKNIGSGQGVFVKSIQAGDVTFKSQHKVSGNNAQFFRAPEEDTNAGRSWYKMSGDSGFATILVGFVPGATDNFDTNFDGEFVNEGVAIEFYSLIGNDKYAIQGQSELIPDVNREVPLGIEVVTAGTYTISILEEYLNPDFNIILDDTFENIQTDLRLSDYTFNLASPIEANDRFVLRYVYNQTLGLEDISATDSDIKVLFRNSNLISIVDGELQPSSIQLFDYSGKSILLTDYKETLPVKGLTTGIYLVKYAFENKNSITKKLLIH
ncbi:MAG: T9SS type A sorting domain-containing protein [Flavobacteriaceae bacterium]|nr:T9SS type A sorting domain-containing protein [Flavobacteriaceae bacterium]NNK26990.1 T9SS type A sorting domain-containing protein [Flavobacteriaceae bacterium]RZV66313.1 MAG: T9SS type A sorting domain-containing protein [Flavobacteriaceae bacterium]RZW48683.1 MAG: T9SS type A sorting domain-containing protein [Flavobacteriaceae bacterium]